MSTNNSTASTDTAFKVSIDNLRAIGRGVRIGESFADHVMALLPLDFDHSKRGAVRDFVREVLAVDFGMSAEELHDKHLRSIGPKGGQRPVDKNAQTGFTSVVRTIQNRLSAEADTDKNTATNLLTRAGVNASLEDVIAAWKSANTK